MKALVIDPQTQTVKAINFSADLDAPMHTLLGKVLSMDIDFENGDVLYIDIDGIKDNTNNSFLVSATGQTVFGKALVLAFSKRNDCDIVNCRSSIKSILGEIVFCDTEETQAMRDLLSFPS